MIDYLPVKIFKSKLAIPFLFVVTVVVNGSNITFTTEFVC